MAPKRRDAMVLEEKTGFWWWRGWVLRREILGRFGRREEEGRERMKSFRFLDRCVQFWDGIGWGEIGWGQDC